MLLVNVNIFLIFDEHLLFSDRNCISLVEFNILRNLLRYILDFVFVCACYITETATAFGGRVGLKCFLFDDVFSCSFWSCLNQKSLLGQIFGSEEHLGIGKSVHSAKSLLICRCVID